MKAFDDYPKDIDINGGSFELPYEEQEALGRMRRDDTDNVTKGRAPSDIGKSLGEHANVIPSNHSGGCKNTLIVFCYDQDSFERRIFEALDHATLSCPGRNKRILFATTQWNTKVRKKLDGYIKAVRSNNVEIIFIFRNNNQDILMQ